MPNADHEGPAAMLPDDAQGAGGAPGSPGVTRPSGRRGRPVKHGLRAMRLTFGKLTTRRLDGRSAVARAVRSWKDDIRRDLGGDLSRSQEAILELAAKTWVIVSSLDDYISRQPSLVTRRRQVIPVVRDRMQIADSLLRHLTALGLDRKTPIADLASYVASKSTPPA